MVPGNFHNFRAGAGRKCDIEIEVYGSESSLAWRHERSSELWLGHRDKANELSLSPRYCSMKKQGALPVYLLDIPRVIMMQFTIYLQTIIVFR